MNLFDELQWRGLIKQTTSTEVERLLNNDKISFYCGFDATADSLHVGSLLPLIMMLRLQKAGHTPIALVGGMTTRIGDPSFKAKEREVIDLDKLNNNLTGITNCISKIIDCELVNNMQWYEKMNLIEFFSKVGKHASMNDMLSKDAVKTRLNDPDKGISFTEFSYMLFQAYDFAYLSQNKNVVLQAGGSDQWSNITMGTQLTRKLHSKEVHGLTFPLLIKSDGTKFGKSESGTIWLDNKKTSVFDFYQFFFSSEDADVISLLKWLTFLSKEEIESLELSVRNEPEKRLAQKALAREMTLLVHGQEELTYALDQSSKLFQTKDWANAIPDLGMHNSEIIGLSLIDLLVELELSKSKGEAKRDIQGNGIRINSVKQNDISRVITTNDIQNNIVVISKGKSQHKVVKVN